AGVREHIADVAYTGEVHNHALEAQAVAGVLRAAVAAQIQVPPVILGLHAQLFDAALQQVQPLLALAAADDLADAGHQTVRRGDGLAVVVKAHVESLDILGVIGDEHGLFEDLLGEIALVLRLQVAAPGHGELEVLSALAQEFHGLSVADAAEIGIH